MQPLTEKRARQILRHLRIAATGLDNLDNLRDVCILTYGVVIDIDSARDLEQYRNMVKKAIPRLLAIFKERGWRVPNPRWQAPAWLQEDS